MHKCIQFADPSSHHGCQMVNFYTQNPKLDIFWRALEWKMVYFMTLWNIIPNDIWHILWQFGLGSGRLVYFSPFWYV
jgi:hypothetical protein